MLLMRDFLTVWGFFPSTDKIARAVNGAHHASCNAGRYMSETTGIAAASSALNSITDEQLLNIILPLLQSRRDLRDVSQLYGRAHVKGIIFRWSYQSSG